MVDNAITILTYNIYDQPDGPFAFEKRINLLADTIAGVNPDVICLQEVPSDQFLRGLTAFLHRKSGRALRVAMTVAPRDGGRDSRVALFHPGTRRTAKRLQTDDGQRFAVEVQVTTPALTVVSAHLESSGSDARIAQAEALVAATEGNGALVVCGDLNATPGSPELAVMERSLSRLAPSAEVGQTFPTGLRPEHAKRKPAVLDHILGRGVTLIASGVAGDGPGSDGLWPSDHVGVWATLSVP